MNAIGTALALFVFTLVSLSTITDAVPAIDGAKAFGPMTGDHPCNMNRNIQ